jgi:hypothetical protein
MARINLTGAVLSATVLLSGCATFNQFTEKHPFVTAVGMTLIAGSIVATANASGHGHDPNCGTGLPHGCDPVGSSATTGH